MQRVTIQERMQMCMSCYAGTRCGSYCRDNAQTGLCLAAYRREKGVQAYCRGFDNGHKMGFEAGFQAALNTFSMKLHDLSHEISFFEPEAIEARYQDWFGTDKQTVLQVFEEPPQEAEA